MVVMALEVDLESTAEDAQGVVIGVEGAVDDGSHHAFGVVVDQGLLEHGFAGAGLAQHQAESALLGVDPQDVEDLLLMFQQGKVLDIEGMALETEIGANHG